MNQVILPAIAIALVLGWTPDGAGAQDDTPERQASASASRDFSGTWLPDLAKAGMVGSAPGASRPVVVTQTGDEVVFGGERYRLDGSESTGESRPGYRPESMAGWALIGTVILTSPALVYFLSSRNKSPGQVVLGGTLLGFLSATSNLLVLTSRHSTAGLAYLYLIPLQFLAIPLGYEAGRSRRVSQLEAVKVGGNETRWRSRRPVMWFRWAVLVIVVTPPVFMHMRQVYRRLDTGASFTTSARWSGNSLVVTSVGSGDQSYTRTFALTLNPGGDELTTQTVITVNGRELRRFTRYWTLQDPRRRPQ